MLIDLFYSIAILFFYAIRRKKGAFMDEKITAIYCRVSTDTQINGLESQERALIDYCNNKSIRNFKIYRELGISGSKQSRPSLDRLMQDCRTHVIDSVVVYSFSRFARSTKHLILALEEFDSLGVRFLSVTENLDTKTAFGRTIFQIIASIAELERELIRERVRTGLKNAKAKGKQIGAKPKFTNLEAFTELKQRGLSSRQIAKILNTSHATVNRLLKNSGTLTPSVSWNTEKCQ